MIKTRTSVTSYLDTNALVYGFFDKTEKGDTVRELISKGCTISALTIDELLWVARRNGQTDYIGITHELMMTANIEFIEVQCTTYLRASEIMKKHNLKPRDAMHAAIMEEEGTKTIISYDKDFDKIEGIERIAP